MSSAASRQSGIIRHACLAQIESLESRIMLSNTTPAALPNPPVPLPPLPIGTEPLQGVVGTPISLSPAMMNQLLGIDQIFYSSNGTVEQANGQGQTIAIVDAYGSPTIANDVATFDAHWGLSNADGGGNFFLTVQALAPTVNTISEPQTDINGWALETSLDVEWAHAIAPGAHIDLVEAPSDSLLDLLDADVYANALPGVTVNSNSWGSSNLSLIEPDRYDGFLTTPQSKIDINEGVTVFFASGDIGGSFNYPAASDQVIPVGGMTTDVDLQGNLLTLGDWTGSGGAEDTNYTPAYNEPLVSMDADPETGVWIYDTTPSPADGFAGGWNVIGGTSLATPLWAAYMSTIDQGLVLEGQATPTSPQVFQDIEIAGEGSPFYFDQVQPTNKLNTYPLWPSTGPVPDGANIPSNANTGFGLPNTELLTDLFVSGPSSFAFLERQVAPTDPGIAPSNGITSFGASLPRISFVSGPTTVVAGQTMSPLTFDVNTDTNTLNTAFTGAVTLSVLNGATLMGTVTVDAVGGVATFSNVSIDITGSGFVLEATASGVIPAQAAPIAVSPAAATQMIVSAEPTSIWQYSTTTPVAVTLEDAFGNHAVNNDSTVTLSVAVGPGTFSGATTAPVINGVATFTGLGFNVAGAYELELTDPGLPAVFTNSFDVVAIPLQNRTTFNGGVLSARAIVFQEQRNAVVFAAAGPPSGAAAFTEDVSPAVQAAVNNAVSPFASPASASGSGSVNQVLDSGANLRSDDATAAVLGN